MNYPPYKEVDLIRFKKRYTKPSMDEPSTMEKVMGMDKPSTIKEVKLLQKKRCLDHRYEWNNTFFQETRFELPWKATMALIPLLKKYIKHNTTFLKQK